MFCSCFHIVYCWLRCVFFLCLFICLIYALFCITPRLQLRAAITHTLATNCALTNTHSRAHKRARAPRGGAPGCQSRAGRVCCCSSGAHPAVRNVRVCTGREKRQPGVLILTAHLALLEGDCRWRLELSEMRAHAAHEAPPLLPCVCLCMCNLSGNVQITKIVSFLHCYTAVVVGLCHTLDDL